MFCDIQIKLDLPEDTTLEEATGEALAKSMESEIVSFEEWFEGQGNSPMVGVERAILRTYIAWKLRYEEQGT